MQNNSQKFKTDIRVRSYQFALTVIKFIDELNKNDWSIQVIAKQLLRSATSIGANIIEAQAGSTKRDFTNFFSYALKSANETKFWIGLLRDSEKSNREKADELLQECSTNCQYTWFKHPYS
ncbi:MAG: four helix bundle protein [Patescibacteria group bacterium]